MLEGEGLHPERGFLAREPQLFLGSHVPEAQRHLEARDALTALRARHKLRALVDELRTKGENHANQAPLVTPPLVVQAPGAWGHGAVARRGAASAGLTCTRRTPCECDVAGQCASTLREGRGVSN